MKYSLMTSYHSPYEHCSHSSFYRMTSIETIRSTTTVQIRTTSSPTLVSWWAPSWWSSSRWELKKLMIDSETTTIWSSLSVTHQRESVTTTAQSCIACKDWSSQLSKGGITSERSTSKSTNTMNESKMEISTGLFQANSLHLWDRLTGGNRGKDLDSHPKSMYPSSERCPKP